MDLLVLPSEALKNVRRALGTLERCEGRTAARSTRIKALQGDPEAQKIVDAWDREDGKPEVPTYLPDGTDVSDVDQVAAMMLTDRKTAAHYVLETKGFEKAVRKQARGILQGSPDYSDGIMLALVLKNADAERIAQRWEHGMGSEDLHITLGYYGDVQDTKITEQELIKAAAQIVAKFRPFEVNLNGITRFSGDERDAVVVNADSSVIEDIRAEVVRLTGKALYRNHGYTPHLTIGYLGKDDDLPVTRWEDTAVRITHLQVAYGKNSGNLRFGRQEKTDAQEMDSHTDVELQRTHTALSRATDILQAKKVPRDGDGDGFIFDGKPNMMPAPKTAQDVAALLGIEKYDPDDSWGPEEPHKINDLPLDGLNIDKYYGGAGTRTVGWPKAYQTIELSPDVPVQMTQWFIYPSVLQKYIDNPKRLGTVEAAFDYDDEYGLSVVLEDGHHRLIAARMLGLPIKVRVRTRRGEKFPEELLASGEKSLQVKKAIPGLKLPKDGDGDGFIFDGKPNMMPAPKTPQAIANLLNQLNPGGPKVTAQDVVDTIKAQDKIKPLPPKSAKPKAKPATAPKKVPKKLTDHLYDEHGNIDFGIDVPPSAQEIAESLHDGTSLDDLYDFADLDDFGDHDGSPMNIAGQVTAEFLADPWPVVPDSSEPTQQVPSAALLQAQETAAVIMNLSKPPTDKHVYTPAEMTMEDIEDSVGWAYSLTDEDLASVDDAPTTVQEAIEILTGVNGVPDWEAALLADVDNTDFGELENEGDPTGIAALFESLNDESREWDEAPTFDADPNAADDIVHSLRDLEHSSLRGIAEMAALNYRVTADDKSREELEDAILERMWGRGAAKIARSGKRSGNRNDKDGEPYKYQESEPAPDAVYGKKLDEPVEATIYEGGYSSSGFVREVTAKVPLSYIEDMRVAGMNYLPGDALRELRAAGGSEYEYAARLARFKNQFVLDFNKDIDDDAWQFYLRNKDGAIMRDILLEQREAGEDVQVEVRHATLDANAARVQRLFRDSDVVRTDSNEPWNLMQSESSRVKSFEFKKALDRIFWAPSGTSDVTQSQTSEIIEEIYRGTFTPEEVATLRDYVVRRYNSESGSDFMDDLQESQEVLGETALDSGVYTKDEDGRWGFARPTPPLPQLERNALASYVGLWKSYDEDYKSEVNLFRANGGGYKELNATLRNGGALNRYQERMVEVLMDLAEKGKDHNGYEVYRGAKPFGMFASSRNLKGFVFRDNGFVSSSLDRSISDSFANNGIIFSYEIPPGTPSVNTVTYGREQGDHVEEREIFLPPGFGFEVLSDSGPAQYTSREIRLRVIPPADLNYGSREEARYQAAIRSQEKVDEIRKFHLDRDIEGQKFVAQVEYALGERMRTGVAPSAADSSAYAEAQIDYAASYIMSFLNGENLVEEYAQQAADFFDAIILQRNSSSNDTDAGFQVQSTPYARTGMDVWFQVQPGVRGIRSDRNIVGSIDQMSLEGGSEGLDKVRVHIPENTPGFFDSERNVFILPTGYELVWDRSDVDDLLGDILVASIRKVEDGNE